ncbi:MAG: TPM domain-containing protein [Gammaproteobacteria bacterium]|nr:TPM domain-containing protein [Gammaproteobacteria bacterium]MDH5276065.1 TPM domain-containing protein [Gammaproteobacteria bacterium]
MADSAVVVAALEVAAHPAAGKQMLRRWLQHLTISHRALRRYFPPATLAAIDAAIATSEQQHRAEIRCVVETALSASELFRGVSSAARAAEIFSSLRVWDTAENNGVLLYVLLAERKIEIVADRGFAASVPAEVWQEICAQMAEEFAAGHYDAGVLGALSRISAIACRCFPAQGNNANELPDRTVLF